jgi:membrane fusion protein, multidrug efflux system
MKKLVILLALLAACGGKKEEEGGGKGGGRGGRGGSGGGKLQYPVDVAVLETKQMQYTVTAPGSIDAFQQVQITARVPGAVDKVGFTEGQVVKAGEVMALIESERYQIAVDQAKNAVAKAQATQKAAEAALQRRLNAQRDSPGVVAGEEIEQKQTQVDTAKADVGSAQQALRVAMLNLRDSMVRAPIAGVVQTRTVQQGQYLQAGAVLATILQREPLLLRFQVREQEAPRLKPDMAATFKLASRDYTAKLSLIGGAADPATRMVPITAQVDSTDHQYWLRPGAFVQVTVPIGDARKSIVVPSLAVAPTEKGNVVYVIEDNTARVRVVELGMNTPDGGVELRRGVKEGELIVVRGIEPLSEGAPVKIDSKLTLEQAFHRADETTKKPDGVGSGAEGSGSGAAGSASGGSAAGSAAGSGSGRRRRGAKEP